MRDHLRILQVTALLQLGMREMMAVVALCHGFAGWISL